jgi:hypothetical protein
MMKTARTYVFMFVPIPPGWLSHEPMIPGVRAGSNGSSPPDQKHDEGGRWRIRHGDGCETQALPHHLFWTWFVDNPRVNKVITRS